MDKGKYSLLIGFYIYIALTASLTSASEKDSRNIGDSVWNCTVEAMNKTLHSTFSSNISCEDQNRFQTCLNRNLKSSTKTMVQYSKSLATCKFPVQAVGSQAEACVKDYFKHISTSPYIKKIQTKMNTTSSSSLPTEQQKLYFCEALLLTSEAVGREVIFYCNLGGLEMYDKYFILSKLEYACKKALGVSLNDTNINDGGHTHTGGGAGDFDFGNFFSDPLFHITPFPTGAGTQTKTSTGSSGNTGTGNNIVSGPGGGTTSTTSASLSNHGDAHAIGHVVWRCSSQTFHSILYSIFLDDIQCRFQNQYSACLGSELSQSTRALQQYNQELYSGCTYVSQASQFAETCVVERENAMTSWNCLASIEAKMATALSTNLTFDQQKTFYCEAIILASDCIGNNAILPCGLEGLELYTNYFTFVPLVQSCYAALGRSPDVVNINDGGNQQTGMTGTTTTTTPQPQTPAPTTAATTKMIPTTTTLKTTTTMVQTTTPTTTKVPTTMKTKTVVPSTTKYPTTVTTTKTTLPSTTRKATSMQTTSSHTTKGSQGDATSIGHVVWKCSSQTFSNNLYSIFLDDIQCRFRNQYDTCLGSELAQNTQGIRQYNRELYNGCNLATQVAQSAENCVVEREKSMASWNCLAKIDAKMATLSSGNLTFNEQKTLYCEALIVASDCIGNNAILPCGLEGLVLYTEYFTLVPLVQACYAALGRSPDVTDINDGGNQQTASTASASKTTIIKASTSTTVKTATPTTTLPTTTTKAIPSTRTLIETTKIESTTTAPKTTVGTTAPSQETEAVGYTGQTNPPDNVVGPINGSTRLTFGFYSAFLVILYIFVTFTT